jgi:hypothetical protein
MPTERRKNPRLGLAIPVRVQGWLGDGSSWEEISGTIDVSSGGACFGLNHEVELGQVLLLSAGLPKRLRQYDLHDASYRVYTLVRSVRRIADPPRVGVMFFGKYPPRGFTERPGALYLLPSDSLVNAPAPRGLREDGDSGAVAAPITGGFTTVSRTERPPETGKTPALSRPPVPSPGPPREFLAPRDTPADRRVAPRIQVFVNFTIQQVDEWGVVLQEELTVADNVSKGGARVMTSLSFHVGDVILVQEAGGGFATRAEVRAVTKVQSAIERLHLHFLDRQAPDRMLKQ